MNTVKKTLPCELYDPAGLEDWFAQMAEQGLHLVKCGGERAAFEKGVPTPGVRYRLEAQGYYENDPDKNRDYREFGWEHVTTIPGFYYIYRSQDPAAPELHTDPVTQSYTMKRLMGRQRRWFLWWPLWCLFCLRHQVVLLVTSPAQIPRNIILRDTVLCGYLILLFALLYELTIHYTQMSVLRRLQKRLAAGLPMDRSKHYPRSFWRHGFSWIIILLLFSSIPLSLCLDNRAPQSTSLEDYPHVTLEQLLSPVPVRPDPDSSYWEGLEFGSSLLVPLQLRFGECGLMGTGDETQKVRLSLHYYQTASPIAAHLLLKGEIAGLEQDLQKREQAAEKDTLSLLMRPYLILNSGTYPMEHPGFDELYALDYQFEDDANAQRAYFGRIGTQVIKLTADLPQPQLALDGIVAMVAQ